MSRECAAHRCPKVDVVIPAFNASRTIAAAIESVQSQTVRDTRVIVIDDGSTDNTAAATAPFVDGKRVVYVRQANGGAASARNAGIARADAPYVSFLDADDQWLPEMLEACLAVIERDSCDLASVDNYKIEMDEGREVNRVVESYEWIERPSDELFLTFVELGGIGGPHKAVFRRSVFDRVGPFDASLPFYEDLDLWVRIARAGLRWSHVRRPLVLYRVGRSSQLSAANPRRNLDCRLRVMRRYAAEAVRRSPAFRGRLADQFWNFGRIYVYEHRAAWEAARCFLTSLRYRPALGPALRSARGWIKARRDAKAESERGPR